MQTILSKHWHYLEREQTASILGSNIETGLDVLEVERRREHFGPNAVTRDTGPGYGTLLFEQINQPVVYILLFAAAVTGFMEEWVDAAVIFGVVLVNTIIGFVQESRAVRAILALEKGLSSTTAVIRSGKQQIVPSEELVPGDIVILRSGDRVPADLRIAAGADLQIDESALTGESLPVTKTVDPLPQQTILSDRTNMAFGSTVVTHGQGKGVVTATGNGTEIGRISAMIATAKAPKTPLQKKIAEFTQLLVWVILGLAVVTKLVGWYKGIPWLDSFKAAVALAVGAIPEGLPAAVTITLAIGVSRMASRRAIIRKLPAVEALGSTTVICSDKTGTLTQNQMTVRRVAVAGGSFDIRGGGYDPTGNIEQDGRVVNPAEYPVLMECLRAGALCNDSALTQTESGYGVEGDPTEGALIVSAMKAGMNPQELERLYRRLDSIPFESDTQFMATLHHVGESSERVVYIKGSAEKILGACTTKADAGRGESTLNRAEFEVVVDDMASHGLRVLAFARLKVPRGTERIPFRSLPDNLTFLGLQGMLDPPRNEAIEAVEKCRHAGIRVKMITGDHPLTAVAIAKMLGLGMDGGRRDAEPEALTGAKIVELDDTEFIDKSDRVDVFARVTPEQKLSLVQALQRKGNVVAMTGDGVNDAPALKRADIGVAMGRGGTEAARQSADMVLTDDNFASIQAAVEEGRGVFDNLTKFIVWTLPTNVGEGLAILLAILIGEILPILPVQILWINMTTAVLLGITLAFEPKEPDLMERAPRDPREPILTHELIVRILIVGLLLVIGSFSLFEWELRSGASVEEARTAAVNMFVFGEMFYLFNCRSFTKRLKDIGYFSNRWLIGGVVLMTLLQIAFTYVPLMNGIFHSAPIPVLAWVHILAFSAVIFVVIALKERFLARRADTGAGAQD